MTEKALVLALCVFCLGCVDTNPSDSSRSTSEKRDSERMASGQFVMYEVREKEDNTIKPRVIGRVYYDLAGAKYLYDFSGIRVFRMDYSTEMSGFVIGFDGSQYWLALTDASNSKLKKDAKLLIRWKSDIEAQVELDLELQRELGNHWRIRSILDQVTFLEGINAQIGKATNLMSFEEMQGHQNVFDWENPPSSNSQPPTWDNGDRIFLNSDGYRYWLYLERAGPAPIGKIEVINASFTHFGAAMPIDFVPNRFVAELNSSEGGAINYSADELIGDETKIVDLE